MTESGPKNRTPKGDRAFVRAKKRGNARGAKGGRKVETTNQRMKETAPKMSSGLCFGEEQPKYANLQLLIGVCWPPWKRESTIDKCLKEQWMRRLIF